MDGTDRSAVLISGYYGFGNVGDEAVLAGMLAGLRARLGGVPFIVLSANPGTTARTYAVEAVNRTDPRAVLGAIRRARLFLSGGGSLIQDATSVRSALYYLGLLGTATALVPRTMVYAAGLGPLRRPILRGLARRVLQRTDRIVVRDAASAALVRALGVLRAPVVAADPAILLEPTEGGHVAEFLTRVGADAPIIGVVVRPWGDGGFVEPLAEAVRRVARGRGAKAVVLPFHPQIDLPVSRRLASAVGAVLFDTLLRPSDMLGLIARMRVLVGVRFHALLFAAQVGVPPVGLAYDPKIEALFEDLDLDKPLSSPLDVESAVSAIERAWEAREALQPTLVSTIERLRARAAVATEEAIRLYTSG